MKITIEPTNPDNAKRSYPHRSVVVSTPLDDVSLSGILKLLEGALCAIGYNLDGTLDIVPNVPEEE